MDDANHVPPVSGTVEYRFSADMINYRDLVAASFSATDTYLPGRMPPSGNGLAIGACVELD